MGQHKSWTPEEDRLLRALSADADETINNIAEKLGVHRSQLMRRMKKLGLSRAVDVWTDERIDFISEFVPKKGYEYCAEKLGISAETVRMKSRRLGLPSPRPRTNYWTPEEDQILLARRREAVSFADIAFELGRTQEAARYRHKVLRGVV